MKVGEIASQVATNVVEGVLYAQEFVYQATYYRFSKNGYTTSRGHFYGMGDSLSYRTRYRYTNSRGQQIEIPPESDFFDVNFGTNPPWKLQSWNPVRRDSKNMLKFLPEYLEFLDALQNKKKECLERDLIIARNTNPRVARIARKLGFHEVEVVSGETYGITLAATPPDLLAHKEYVEEMIPRLRERRGKLGFFGKIRRNRP